VLYYRIKIEIYNITRDLKLQSEKKRLQCISWYCVVFSSKGDGANEVVLLARFVLHCLKSQQRLVENESLDKGTDESDHSKTSVDNFLFLTPRLVLGGQIGQDRRSPFNVSGDGLIIVVLVEVGGLDDSNCEQDLDVDSPADRLDGTKDIRVFVSGTGEVDSGLLDQHTYDGKHANTPVLDFSPTRVSKVGLDVRKTHRVESHITRHGSIEFVWSDQERDGLREFLRVQRNGAGPLRGLRSGGEGRSTCDQEGEDG